MTQIGIMRGYFYPRPPRGGRHQDRRDAKSPRCISIHALREEGDWRVCRSRTVQTNFYPRPPRGGRLCLAQDGHSGHRFLSTPSARRATYASKHPGGVRAISIHALREEGDTNAMAQQTDVLIFLSTPSARRATAGPMERRTVARFLSTPSARRATTCRPTSATVQPNFYPRPPRGGRHCTLNRQKCALQFLSTPSARRATRKATSCAACGRFLSTPSARRATHPLVFVSICETISIHALRVATSATGTDFYPRPPRGGRRMPHQLLRYLIRFLSTPSARRATNHVGQLDSEFQFLSTLSARRATSRLSDAENGLGISIHALREEGDHGRRQHQHLPADFYPRPPRGGRPCTPMPPPQSWQRFLSTPSARRATKDRSGEAMQRAISIHALREEGDFFDGLSALERLISIHALREEGDGSVTFTTPQYSEFLSTPSARRATPASQTPPGRPAISIHALREEGDLIKNKWAKDKVNFYPRPPRGGRRSTCDANCGGKVFLSTPSARRATL